MEPRLETLKGLERRLDFFIADTDLKAAVEARLKRVARTAKIQGFRPGKAPMNLVAQRYSAQIHEDALNEQVNDSFIKIVNDKKLRIAGYPQIEGKPAETGSYAFSATFEVYPEVVLGDLSGKQIERPVLTVTDAEVDKTLEVLRKQRTKFERVERASVQGDRVIIDFKGTIDDVAFNGGTSENFTFHLGEGQMLPEFDSAVLGMKEGDNKTFPLTFPADYHGKDVAGKTAMFTVTVKNVAAPQLPELDEEFARSLGVEEGGMAKLRDDIQKNISREVKQRLEMRAKDSVMQLLLDITPLDVPKNLVLQERARLLENAQREMQQRGFDPKNIPFPPEAFEEQAKRRVSLGLILAEVVRVHSLQAKPEQIKAAVALFAESYDQPTEVVKWHYAEPERLQAFENSVLENNVVEFVYSQAKVVETPVPFDVLMGYDKN